MAKVIPIFKAESLLIPIKFLNAEDIESAHSRFTYFFYNEKACKTCENLPNRHNEDCDGCQQFKGSKRTSKVVTKEGNDFLSMPAGGSKKVKKWLIGRGYEKYKLIDRMPDDVPLSSPIKMIKKTWDYQTEAIQVLLEKRRGILESPPRTGKTVMGAAVICKVGQRAIIIAHQLEWLLNFQETFIGSDTQEKFTNCKSTQIKICKTLNDFQTTDICLTTFSKFMSKAGKKLLAQIRETFGVCIVDECHQTPALETSRVLSRINARYLFGLSGTVERKVTEEIKIATDLIGPVIHKCEV